MDLERALKFIEQAYWRFAKTYAETAPHEYCVKDKLTPELQKEFEWFDTQIKQYGVDEKFFRMTYKYLHLNGKKYWTMEKPHETPILINRANAS